VLIGDVKNFLDGNGAAGIQAEGVSVLDDLGRGKFALALVHIEDNDTQESFVGSRFRVCEGQPERRHAIPFSPGTCRAGGLSKKEGTRATGTLSSVLIFPNFSSRKSFPYPRSWPCHRRRWPIRYRHGWAIDRLGRSLSDLLDTIQHLEACGVLYLDQQAIDTTTPMGNLVFQLTGAFAEFERAA
jgi:hypothetical protein